MTMYSAHNASSRSTRTSVVLVLLAIISLNTPAFTQGKGNGLSVRALSGALVDVTPGQIQTLSFRILNETDAVEEYNETLELPKDWQVVIPTGELTLSAGEESSKLIAFQVPSYAAAGTYEVKYSVQSRRDYSIQDSEVISIVVAPFGKLSMSVEDKPQFVIAGQEFKFRALVLNQGNVTIKARIIAESKHAGSQAKVEPQQVEIHPHTSEWVTITVNTNPQTTKSYTNTVLIRAIGPDTNTSAAPISVGIPIIPRVGSNAAEASIYRYLPAKVIYRERGQSGGQSKQTKIVGEGIIGNDGNKRIEFMASGSGNEKSNVAGWRDEYKLNYLSEDLQLRFGDQDYGLSYLTDYNNYGSGFGVDFAGQSEMKYGAYYETSRWRSPEASTSGAYVYRRFSDLFTMKLNMLQKDQDSGKSVSGYGDNVWSVESDIRTSESSKLQLEYGQSSTNRAGYGNDRAYRFELTGGLGHSTTYSLRSTHAGPDYCGYYRDTDLTRASVVSLIGDNIQTNLSYSEWRQNLKADSDRGIAPAEKLLQIGLRLPLKNNWSLSLEYDNFQRKDRLADSGFDFKSNTARLGVSKAWDKASIRAEVLSSNERDILNHQSDQALNYRLFATYRPDNKQFFTVYGGFGNSSALDGSRLLRGKEFGFSASFKPRNDMTVRAWYSGDTLFGDRPDSDRGEVRFTYKLKDQSTWELLLRQTNILAERDPVNSYEMLYTLPINIPVGRRSDVGLISGRLFDQGKDGSPGIAGALVTAGNSAVVTDSDGRFTLSALPPGTYPLTVDRKSIGLDRTTDCRLPIQVEVKGGKTSTVDMGIVKAASISGQISIAQQAQEPQATGGASVPSNPVFVDTTALKSGGPSVEGILTELSDGTEVLRRLTDSKGYFLFESLRPGNWSLKVYDRDLPPYHYFDITTKDFNLASGGQENVDIYMLRRLRQIKMVDDDSSVVTTMESTDRK